MSVQGTSGRKVGSRSRGRAPLNAALSHTGTNEEIAHATHRAPAERTHTMDEKSPMRGHAAPADDEQGILAGRARALQADPDYAGSWAGDDFEREVRSSLRRVGDLSSGSHEEDADVEYRQLRLEKVVLVGVWSQGSLQEAEDSLRELAALAQTAGAHVLDGLLQRRPMPDPATYLGSGKARELAQIVRTLGADTVITDSELAPSQRRALEDIVQVKVIDRTALILDIFAQHAKSREGKAQVELAQLDYLLPRLRGWGESMSRQAGGRVAGGAGIGSRGPGETKIELDRRRIRSRMAKLRRDLATMKAGRATRRLNRRRHRIPSVVVIGYTNAGKSSLMNVLTGAGVLVENALFATLDPTVRKVQTSDGRFFTLTDTVGFVRSLPTQLVEAFRSTLEEVSSADLIVHVVDASHSDPVGQVRAVHEVLRDVDHAREIPELIVLAKADLADPVMLAGLRSRFDRSVVVSALTGLGIPELRKAIEELLPRPNQDITVVVPYSRGELVARTHAEGDVLSEEFTPDGTRIHALVLPDLMHELRPYALEERHE
ncbi:MAG: GTPase HflX [Arcanobacterium sp.]|nr:GTPase HflX [Arcanobacterium sp.]